MKVKIKNTSNNPIPEYKTPGSAGVDLQANISEIITLKPLERKVIPTGMYLEIPKGFEGQVRPRSGLAIKNGVTCLNTPGTIDSDYRGEVGVILINLSQIDFVIHPGDRIAQLVFAPHETVEFQLVEDLKPTQRGAGGFGSTGV